MYRQPVYGRIINNAWSNERPEVEMLLFIDQSVYQKFGPNLKKIATELKPFDLTSYTYY